jgi:hypothetical protein
MIRHIFSKTVNHPYYVDQNYIVSIRGKKVDDSLLLDIVDLTSNTNNIICVDVDNINQNDVMITIGKSLLYYSSMKRRMVLYSFDRCSNITTIKLKLHKSKQCNNFTAISRANEDILFFKCKDDTILRTVMIRDNQMRFSVIQNVDIKPSEKNTKNKQQHILAHPSDPILFILSASESVLIYDYSNWLRSVRQGTNEETGDNAGDDDSEGDDVVAPPSSTPPQSQGFFRAKNKGLSMLTLIGSLVPPSSKDDGGTHCTHWTIRNDGTLLAVVYNHRITCIYDTSTLSPHINTSGGKSLSLKPIAAHTGIPAGWLIEEICFLSNYPFLIQVYSPFEVQEKGTEQKSLRKKVLKDQSHHTLIPTFKDFQFRNTDIPNIISDNVDKPVHNMILSVHSLSEPSLRVLHSQATPWDGRIHQILGLIITPCGGRIIGNIREFFSSHPTPSKNKQEPSIAYEKNYVCGYQFASHFSKLFNPGPLTYSSPVPVCTYYSNNQTSQVSMRNIVTISSTKVHSSKGKKNITSLSSPRINLTDYYIE